MQESKSFCTNYLTKLSIDLNGIWYSVETFVSDQSYTHFVMADQYSGERTLLM